MTPEKLAELREKRGEAHAEMTAVLEACTDGMGAEDQEKYDRAERAFDEADALITAAERHAERDRSGSLLDDHGDADDAERAAAHRGEGREARFAAAIDTAQRSAANLVSFVRNSDEYREAYVDGYLRGLGLGGEHGFRDMPDEYRAALNLGSDPDGGYTAPVEFQRRLLDEAIAEFGVIRNLAYVFSTSHGRDMEFPRLVDKGQAGWADEVPAEGTNESELTFGAPVVLNAWVATREAITSRDLLQDSVFDIEALILKAFGESFALLENPAFISGDGTKKPTGFLPNVSQVVQGATSATAVYEYDDLVDVQHAIPERHRAKARWLFNDDALKAARKLRDGNGDPIWQPGLQNGIPSTILGKPYSIDPDMPSPAVSTRSIAYGDFTGYWIRDVLDLSIQRLNELLARKRQVLFVADRRVEGKLMEAEKLAVFEHGAAA